jgi:pyruvate, water dikinase
MRITGIPASRGRSTGRARVLLDPAEIHRVRPGEILVAAYAVPDLVLAFDRISGLVTDQGGRFAHAAVVARELGIPAVVGTQIATTEIADGSTLCLDGGAGTVAIVE